LKADGFKGARIGIPRAFFYDRITPPMSTEEAGRGAGGAEGRGRGGAGGGRGGLNGAQGKSMADAIAVLRQQGAVIVDPAGIPSAGDKDPQSNFLLFNQGSGVNNPKGKEKGWPGVLKYRVKART